MSQQQFEGRTALITGASRGIGRAVATRFAVEGAHVILVARTVGGLEEVDDEVKQAGGQATLVPCDLRDGAKVDMLGPAILERFGHLDIFVANAAILGGLMPLGHYEVGDWTDVMKTNLEANWRLCRILDPLLRRADAGRAILVTCAAAREQRPYWGAYATSKAGLEALGKIWAAEASKSQLKVNLLDPGPTATRLRSLAFPGEDKADLAQPAQIADCFVELATAAYQANGTLVTCQR